jgi:hypothetical protein
MSILNPSLPKAYYVSSFISVLNKDIKPMLKILKPTTLQ